MKQPSKKELARIKQEAAQPEKWKKTSSFQADKPTSIRLSDELINNLQKLAELHGEKSYQSLLKQWLIERTRYEMDLVDMARKRRVG